METFGTSVTNLLATIILIVVLVVSLFFLQQATGSKELSDKNVLCQASQTLESKKKDKEAREKAREAALKRQKDANIKKRHRKMAYNKQRREEHEKMICIPTSKSEPPTTAAFLPVFDDGLTSYRHIPHLPHADVAERMLKRIAKEFTPIIRRRGYDVKAVTEFCCCEDGAMYELGGHSSCVRPGCKIAGHDQEDVSGYNRVNFLRRGRTVHTIHLRLRDPDNHEKFRDYGSVRRTMAHELAHCIHRHHEPSFYKLMEEILQHHAVVVRDQQLGTDNASAQNFSEVGMNQDFSVYRSSTSTYG